ncbi:MAG: hypothetical protein AB8H79_01085, partial [Myxococcota bacterium]
MADNPFASPKLSGTTAPSRPNGRSRSLEEARFTPIMDMYMVGMRPWLKFLGVVGIILAALVILGAVLAFLGGL